MIDPFMAKGSPLENTFTLSQLSPYLVVNK